ncbi:MAG: nucleoside 2-deoxyribosyltransferase [Nisaea sp.]|uniref:nucleoside 2-deoxyribosyltransferase n=1 Tax=Nisaea sp. TaxID=2024842 RepID=UPI001B2581E4|nr:nucleoside 2-deoxyribosyltransferase [Nisaea sp.]MBO6561847.1 nucleoside 2-deoxyribosyltransferase [Nisaea sp.]
MSKIYISGALQASTNLQIARDLYEEAARILDSSGDFCFLPHLQTDPERAKFIPSDDVFSRDVRALEDADGVIAFLNEPSHGVGAEIAMALAWGKPILPLIENGGKCSRFLDGLLRSHNFFVITYEDHRHMESEIRKFSSSINRKYFLQNKIGAILG